jgi:hypothetical protein
MVELLLLLLFCYFASLVLFMGNLLIVTRDAPDTELAGYPVNLKAGYRISGKAGYPVNIKINNKI